jgi:hypothetical protein
MSGSGSLYIVKPEPERLVFCSFFTYKHNCTLNVYYVYPPTLNHPASTLFGPLTNSLFDLFQPLLETRTSRSSSWLLA